LQLYPKDMEVYAKRTRVYAAMNNHKKAIEGANQILRNDPENVETYVIRAGSRHQLGDLEGAKQDNDKMSEMGYKQIY